MKQMFCSAILSVVVFLPLVGNSQTGAKSVPQSKSTEKKTTKDDEELLIAQRHAFAVSQVISIADEARSYRDIALRPHVLARAINMSVWTVYDNDPNLINTRLDKVAAVTKADVQRVASKYLTITKRTVVVTMPKPKSAAATTTSSRKGDNHWTEQRRRGRASIVLIRPMRRLKVYKAVFERTREIEFSAGKWLPISLGFTDLWSRVFEKIRAI